MRFKEAVILATVLIAGLSPLAVAQDDELEIPRLEGVLFGNQVSGPRVSEYDLRGRVVVCFHWCVSCPMSTGAFPSVNQLVEKYEDRGLAVVGFQVRRNPEVEENDVVWYLEHLKPKFPVVRLGWVCGWPSRYLPWAVVYDHEGKPIFADNLRGMEEVIVKALDRAPDYLVGGPYSRLSELAGTIAADRENAGRHLGALREIVDRKDGDPEEKKEAAAMLGSVELYFEGQLKKAEEDTWGVVEEAAVYQDLAEMFEGDVLGEQAKKRLEKLRSEPTFADEEQADQALRKARTGFRRLPPPGRYIYHFTEMNYRNWENKVLIARRTRIIAEFRMELERISAAHPETFAAELAGDLLYEHEVPEFDIEGARERVARAEKLLGRTTGTPAELFDACLLLYEVFEGYLESDEIAKKAAELLAAVKKDRAEELTLARAIHRDLNEQASEIEEQVRLGGSTLPWKAADVLAGRLVETAKQAGPESDLARRVKAYVRDLEKSYDGPANLGAAFDEKYRGPGVRIRGVYPGSSARNHGLIVGDVILTFDGRGIKGAQDLRAALADCKPGQTVEVVVRRRGKGGAKETMKIILGRRM